jgi:phosphoribosyl-ATP pyrophosphohydrolase
MNDTIAALEATIRARRSGDPATSYVAKLSAAGRAKIAQKVGEEAVETVIAAMAGNPAEVTSEAADLIFHLALLLADMDLSFDDVFKELERREGMSGIAEKAARKEA